MSPTPEFRYTAPPQPAEGTVVMEKVCEACGAPNRQSTEELLARISRLETELARLRELDAARESQLLNDPRNSEEPE